MDKYWITPVDQTIIIHLIMLILSNYHCYYYSYQLLFLWITIIETRRLSSSTINHQQLGNHWRRTKISMGNPWVSKNGGSHFNHGC